MEPNAIEDSNNFTELVKKNSDESIWTTVIGIGLDLTQDIINTISRTPGTSSLHICSCTDAFYQQVVTIVMWGKCSFVEVDYLGNFMVNELIQNSQ